ncbi:DUF1003 domain-containing protein [Acidisoma sp. L85]|uniref:DUF1003 domain-containing protein n=1 Tax=Acidisoma sp. L85 TaxID=1641850 RepID=UPI00131C2EEE|nr:DUF1003 domain-containing protein [Acidisoma sp. L85]
MTGIKYALPQEELRLLAHLRRRPDRLRKGAIQPGETTGARVSDAVTGIVGSWRFIIIQSILLVIWMILNTIALMRHWDPYPFILLNLVLSFQAAYTAPIIMMSQNRQAVLDRSAAKSDYDVNLKSELEIELLHEKIDHMREVEVSKLIEMIDKLQSAIVDLKLPQV